jgi:hypothetical protein
MQVSTMTVTTCVFHECIVQGVTIIDIAKHIDLDEFILGVKLVYAGGNSIVLRGNARLSKKNKDFYNQVTFTLRGGTPERSASCKLFHNGRLHLTGSRCLDEAKIYFRELMNRLVIPKGEKMVQINSDGPFLQSVDNLIYSMTGKIIGHRLNNRLTINSDSVVIDGDVFVIGTKTLTFFSGKSVKQFEVKFGCVYSRGKLIGTEILHLSPPVPTGTASHVNQASTILKTGQLSYHIRFFQDTVRRTFVDSMLSIHMINMFFKWPQEINRQNLQKAFTENGYVSRYDLCCGAAVNLRFHYNSLNSTGKCPRTVASDLHPNFMCVCKNISVSFFRSGKINITGLTTFEQGQIIHVFVNSFFSVNKNVFL